MKNPQTVEPLRYINSSCMAEIWLGALMRPKLQELGWSQAELARRLDRSPTHVGNLLNDIAPGTKSGKRQRVSLEDCDRVADVMGLPRDTTRRAGGWFVEDRPPSDARTLRLQGYFEQLPEPRQEDAIALLETLWRRHGEHFKEDGGDAIEMPPLTPNPDPHALTMSIPGTRPSRNREPSADQQRDIDAAIAHAEQETKPKKK